MRQCHVGGPGTGRPLQGGRRGLCGASRSPGPRPGQGPVQGEAVRSHAVLQLDRWLRGRAARVRRTSARARGLLVRKPAVRGLPPSDHQPSPAQPRGTGGRRHRGGADPGSRRRRGPRRPRGRLPAGTGEGVRARKAPKPRVVVVFGGRSAEHEVSVVSAHSVLAVLDPDRYEVLTIGIDKKGRWHMLSELPGRQRGALPSVTDGEGPGVALSREPGESALVADDGTRQEIDVVFPLLHGPFGEDGTIQGMLELAGIPYVGAGVLGSAVGMDKAVQKVLFEDAGLLVVPHEVVHAREWEDDREAVEARAEGLGLPLFVKPAALGSSVGIAKVKRPEDLRPALEEAFRFGPKALLERSVEGAREIECGVLGNDDPVASVAGEILPSGEFYDYAAKYLDEATRLVIPADLPEPVAEEIQRLAVAAFRAIDCEGMARVDFFLRDPDELILNEINTIPGFTEVSMYPKLWEASGVAYAELVDRLVELAVERHDREAKRATR